MAKYKFKGYTISCCGYHQPDHCIWWEAVDSEGNACFHNTTLRQVEFMILEYEWEKRLREKDEVIEKLKRERSVSSAAVYKALSLLRERMVAAIYDGSVDCHEALEEIESALAESEAAK